jgi:hypothetical protein
MYDPMLGRVAETLQRPDRLAASVATLLAELDPPDMDPDALERRLRRDPRFLLLDPQPALPGLEAWAPQQRSAYARVLSTLDGPAARLVILRAPAPGDGEGAEPPDGGLAPLLRRTLLTLLEREPAGSLTAAAQETLAALTAMDRVSLSAGTTPSTTPPPGPPPLPLALPSPPRPPRPRPHPPGSRPG